MRMPLNILGWADKLAISASTVCAIHCLGLPVALVAFPAIGGTFLGDEAFHFWLIWAVVPMSLFSLSLGCCLLYTSPSPRDLSTSRMPSSA